MAQNPVKLSSYSNYRIGGPANSFFQPKTEEELLRMIAEWKEKSPEGKNVFVLGGGTNILIDDAGYEGLVIKPTMNFIEREGETVRVGAGATMEKLVEFAVQHSLSGLEWAGGLPGTVGGAIRGNAGCFGGEMKDVIVSVSSIDLFTEKPTILSRNTADCEFGYRSSVFKTRDIEGKGKEVIVSATLRLKPGDAKAIREGVEQKIQYRTERHPIEYPNIGSIFKNVPVASVPEAQQGLFKDVIKQDPFPVVPAAYLISEAGLKGVSFGGAMISPKHPNFIVNVLDAKAHDVKTLIQLVKYTIHGKFGIHLEEEVVYL